MVAGGMGITLLPTLAIPFEATPNSGLAVIPFGAQAPHRTIGLAWRKNAPRHRAFEALAQTLSAIR